MPNLRSSEIRLKLNLILPHSVYDSQEHHKRTVATHVVICPVDLAGLISGIVSDERNDGSVGAGRKR